MKETDLRLGNLVKKINTNEIITVDFGWLRAIKRQGNLFCGIELSEEVLKKCGWGRSDEHELCDNSNDIIFVYDWHFKRLEIQIDTEFNGVEYNLKHIKYLHQLQNIYFSITNKELKIKPPLE